MLRRETEKDERASSSSFHALYKNLKQHLCIREHMHLCMYLMPIDIIKVCDGEGNHLRVCLICNASKLR
jgi:hypothetical protein